MNNNINEDYCSYPVSKLLKDKCFDVKCSYSYNNSKVVLSFGYQRNNSELNFYSDIEEKISRPTHALAIKCLKLSYYENK